VVTQRSVKLYDALKNSGFSLPEDIVDGNAFTNAMSDEKRRSALYDSLTSHGFKLPDDIKDVNGFHRAIAPQKTDLKKVEDKTTPTLTSRAITVPQIFDSAYKKEEPPKEVVPSKHTIKSFMEKYAPETENNTPAYIKFITDTLGLPEDTNFADVKTEPLANAIADFEGWNTKDDNPAKRNNNPGNLRYAGQTNATGQDENGFAIFPDPATGFEALYAQIDLDKSRTGETAPATEETPEARNLRANKIREGLIRPNFDEEGKRVGESTHIMRTEFIEGRWVSFPTLFPLDEKGEEWEEHSKDDEIDIAYKKAEDKGELFEFGQDKDSAIQFGEGSWKTSGDSVIFDQYTPQIPGMEATEVESTVQDSYLRQMASKIVEMNREKPIGDIDTNKLIQENPEQQKTITTLSTKGMTPATVCLDILFNAVAWWTKLSNFPLSSSGTRYFSPDFSYLENSDSNSADWSCRLNPCFVLSLIFCAHSW